MYLGLGCGVGGWLGICCLLHALTCVLCCVATLICILRFDLCLWQLFRARWIAGRCCGLDAALGCQWLLLLWGVDYLVGCLLLMVLLRLVVMFCGCIGGYGYGSCGLDCLVNSVVSCFIYVLCCGCFWMCCSVWVGLMFGGWLLAVGVLR